MLPNDIPKSPERIFHNEWLGMGDWLGTYSRRSTKFRSFSDARKYVRSLKIRSEIEWTKYCKERKIPLDIPTSPRTTYRNDWQGFGNWLGTFRTKTRNARNFKSAKKFVKTLNLKTHKDWIAYCKSGKKPSDIPVSPRTTYRKEWRGVSDWLGTNTRR